MADLPTGADERYIVVSTDSHVGPSVTEQLRAVLRRQAPRRLRPLRRGDEGRGPALLALERGEGRGRRELDDGRQATEAGLRRSRRVRQGRRHPQRRPDGPGVPAAELRGQPAARAQDQRGPARRHGPVRGGRLRDLPRRTQRAVDPVLDDRSHLLGRLPLQPARARRRAHLQPLARRLRRRGSRAPLRHRPHPDLRPRGVRPRGRVGRGARAEGINLPAPRGDFPMLNDPVWEPLWAVCEETGLSLNTHGGGGEHYPYEGPRRAGDVHDGDRLADPPRRLGDDPRRHLRSPPGAEARADRAVDRLGGRRSCATWTGSSTGPNGDLAARVARRRHRRSTSGENCFFGASFLSNWEAKFAIEHDLVAQHHVGRRLPARRGHLAAHARGDARTRSATSTRSTSRSSSATPPSTCTASTVPSCAPVADRIGPTVAELAAAPIPPRTRRSASTPSAPRGSSSDGRRHRAAAPAVPRGHRRRGRAPPRARLGAAEGVRRPRRRRARCSTWPARRWATTPTATRSLPCLERRSPRRVRPRVLQRPPQLGGLRHPCSGRCLDEVGKSAEAAAAAGDGRRRAASASATTGPSSCRSCPSLEGVAPRGQRSDRVPPGLHHLRRRPVRRHDVLVPARGVRPRGRDDVVRQRLAPRRRARRLHDLRRRRRTRRVPRAAATSRCPSRCTYELGDITVHTHLTIHGAGANRMDRPRWAYILDHPARGRLLERLAVPELRPPGDEAVGAAGRRALPGDQLMVAAPVLEPRRSCRCAGSSPISRPPSTPGSRTAGVGPFFWFDDVAVDGRPPPWRARRVPARARPRSPTPATCRSSWSARRTTTPGVFRDVFPRGEYGLHHLARDLRRLRGRARRLRRRRAPRSPSRATGGRSRTCWVDTSPTLGFMVELLEPSRARDDGLRHTCARPPSGGTATTASITALLTLSAMRRTGIDLPRAARARSSRREPSTRRSIVARRDR